MEYTVIRSARKTIAIEITPAGRVLVRCPRRMPRGEVQRFVDSRQDWIAGHLKKLGPPPEILSAGQWESLTRRAAAHIPERVAWFAPLVGVTYGRITIRSQRTRWGSCSGAGNLNFNCLLMLAPEDVLDYVVVHELCHRKHMNHSPAFWAEVERVLPNWQEQRRWLKENGNALIARLPGA